MIKSDMLIAGVSVDDGLIYDGTIVEDRAECRYRTWMADSK